MRERGGRDEGFEEYAGAQGSEEGYSNEGEVWKGYQVNV